MERNNMILVGVLIIVVAAAGFFGGMQYQKTQRANQFMNGGARRSGTGGNGNFQPVRGQIISADPKSITVKLTDGSSKIVLLSDSTQITESTQAGKDALVNGKTVLVIGQTNSDGSVTAQNVQLNPQQPGGGAGR